MRRRKLLHLQKWYAKRADEIERVAYDARRNNIFLPSSTVWEIFDIAAVYRVQYHVLQRMLVGYTAKEIAFGINGIRRSERQKAEVNFTLYIKTQSKLLKTQIKA